MKIKAAALAAVCALLAGREPVCLHPASGATRPVSLDRVRRAQAEVKARMAFSWEKATALSAEAPFDSGLPACAARRTRVLRTEVPRELVGREIAFAPAERMPRADVRVATSCRRISEAEADALADPALAERLGVRCAPTLVRVRSEVELELVEGP